MRPGEATRAFVDRPVGDPKAASDAARLAAAEWGLDPPRLVRSGMNALFETGAFLLRVGSPSVRADAAVELTDVLRRHGLSVPRSARPSVVQSGELQVTCWHRIEASTRPIDWRSVGVLVRRLHRLDPAVLPATVPLPSPTRFPWWDFDTLLGRVGPALDPAARAGLEAAVERHRGWREMSGEVVCHGDVHPGNVLMTIDGPVVLDWDLLCWAPPAWDHAALMRWAPRWGGRAGEYEDFAAGYGRSYAADPVGERFAELRLVAATLMRVATAMTDPAAAEEAERRLRYWRGDPAAPAWTAQ